MLTKLIIDINKCSGGAILKAIMKTRELDDEKFDVLINKVRISTYVLKRKCMQTGLLCLHDYCEECSVRKINETGCLWHQYDFFRIFMNMSYMYGRYDYFQYCKEAIDFMYFIRSQKDKNSIKINL